MSVRAPETDAPASATARSRLDEVLRAGVARRREQEADTGMFALRARPGQLLPVPATQPPPSVPRQNLPGLWQPRETYTPRAWDVLPKEIVEFDKYGNELTYERGEGGTATLRKMTAESTADLFPGATVEFAGYANEEYPTLWTWGPMYITFSGTSRDNLSISDMSLSFQTLVEINDAVPKEAKAQNLLPPVDGSAMQLDPSGGGFQSEGLQRQVKTFFYLLGEVCGWGVVQEVMDMRTILMVTGNPKQARLVIDKIRKNRDDPLNGAKVSFNLNPAQSGFLSRADTLFEVAYRKPDKRVHAYTLQEDGHIVFDEFRSTGPPPMRTTFRHEDLEEWMAHATAYQHDKIMFFSMVILWFLYKASELMLYLLAFTLDTVLSRISPSPPPPPPPPPRSRARVRAGRPTHPRPPLPHNSTF